MGQQVNFFMRDEDLAHFEAMLRERGGISFVPFRLPSPQLETLSTLAVPEMGQTWLKVYLIREIDFSDVRFNFVPVQNYWTIDDLRSPVVEFDRCYYTDQMVRSGRLYFKMGFFDDDEKWVTKSPEFVAWAKRLLSWVRRHYERDPKTGFYVGPYTRQWVSQHNGELNPF